LIEWTTEGRTTQGVHACSGRGRRGFFAFFRRPGDERATFVASWAVSFSFFLRLGARLLAAPRRPGRWLGATVLGLLGCGSPRPGPELLALVEVVPAEVQPGDRLEILGSRLPSGETTTARVSFRGTLWRPGREPVERAEILVDDASLTRDRVSVAITDELLARFVGRGDDALHTTFVGAVEVEIPTATGMPVRGSVKQEVRIDLAPRPPRDAVADARAAEGERALAWLGVEASPGGTGGVVVERVTEEGPAARAGVQAGDRIERLDGLTVLGPGDLVPRPSAQAPVLGYRRGDQVVDAAVTTAGFRPGSLRDLVPAIAVLGALAIVLALRAARPMRFASWAELRLVGQASPRAVRLGEARSWIVEAVRSIVREDDGPGASPASRGWLAYAPHVVFVTVSVTFGALPFAGMVGASQIDVATLLLASQTALLLVGLATCAWSADRRWSLGRALRATFRLLSLAVPTFVAALCVVLRSGSVRAAEVLAAQAGAGASWLEAGGWPWTWNAARNPLVFAVFALGLATTLVEPDDTAREPLATRADRGLRPALFFLAEWTHVFVLAALGALLFLGGWLVPGLPADRQAASLGWTVVGTVLFLLKAWSIVLAVVAARWTFPRIREGLVARVAWTRFAPIAALVLVVAIAWERLRPAAVVELVVAAVVLSSGALVAALVGVRVARALRSPRPRLSLNPFL